MFSIKCYNQKDCRAINTPFILHHHTLPKLANYWDTKKWDLNSSVDLSTFQSLTRAAPGSNPRRSNNQLEHNWGQLLVRSTSKRIRKVIQKVHFLCLNELSWTIEQRQTVWYFLCMVRILFVYRVSLIRFRDQYKECMYDLTSERTRWGSLFR